MIIIQRDATKLPEIEGASYSQVLEGFTGADCLLSNTGMPAESSMLIQEHLEGKAMLVQIKIGADLASSIIDGRLVESLCRMKESGASPQQRWLVPVGVYTEQDDTGLLLINGKRVMDYGIPQPLKYSAYETAISAWQLRGGCVFNPYNVAQLVKWITRRERWLIDHESDLTVNAIDRVQSIQIVDDNNPFQTVQRPSKGYEVLVHLLGPKTADALWQRAGSLSMAMAYLTDPSPTLSMGLKLGSGKVNELKLRQAFRALPGIIDADCQLEIVKVKQ